MKRIPTLLVAVMLLLTANLNGANVKTGIEVLRENNFDILQGKRVGLTTKEVFAPHPQPTGDWYSAILVRVWNGFCRFQRRLALFRMDQSDLGSLHPLGRNGIPLQELAHNQEIPICLSHRVDSCAVHDDGECELYLHCARGLAVC